MGLHRITLTVIIVMVFLVLVACQESEEEEDVYLDKMWAWTSLVVYAFVFESEEAMLAAAIPRR